MEGESSQKPIHRSRPVSPISLKTSWVSSICSRMMLFSHKRLTCWCCSVVISQCSTGSSSLWQTLQLLKRSRLTDAEKKDANMSTTLGGVVLSVCHKVLWNNPKALITYPQPQVTKTEYHFSPPNPKPIQLPKAVFWSLKKKPPRNSFCFFHVCKQI